MEEEGTGKPNRTSHVQLEPVRLTSLQAFPYCNPHQLKERLRSWKFVKLQRRRSQTEGRISIIIHNFLGCPIRSKGIEHRQLAVGWGVLTHNLWVLARLPKRQAKKKAAPLRKAA